MDGKAFEGLGRLLEGLPKLLGCMALIILILFVLVVIFGGHWVLELFREHVTIR